MKLQLKVAAVAGVVLLATAPAAFAHSTPGSYCDTSTARGGHTGAPAPTDEVVNGPAGYQVWAPGGHYVVRDTNSDDNYVEVVGGQGFNRGGNQGGYVQGSLHPAGGPAEADFHANSFAGSNSPNASGFGCVHVQAAGQDRSVATPGGSQP
jgi:hypothetical protein